MILLGIALAFAAAFVQSLSYVISGSYVKRTGLPGWTLAAPQQLVMIVPYAVVTWVFRPVGASLADWQPILLAAAVCMVGACCGNAGLFQMQKTVEPSRVAPLQAVKVPLIALFCFLAFGQAVSTVRLAGLALVMVSAVLLCGAGRRIRLSALGWLLFCTASYAVCDTSIAKMLDQSRLLCGGMVRTSLFVMGLAHLATGFLSVPMLLIQKASGAPVPAPRDWVRYALLYGVFWMVAMVALFLAFSLCGVVLGAIVQSSRGLVSVVLGWFLARHGFADVEEPVSASVFRRRLGAAVLLIAAIALYALGQEEPAGEAPRASRRVLSLPATAANPRNGEGDFIRLKDGRILLVYTEYVGASNDDHARAHLVKRISADGGETWSAPVEAAPRLGAMNDMSASLLRMKDGRIGLFFLRKNSTDDCRPVARYSADEGETWSAPVECLPAATNGYYVLNNARAERLSSGRIVLPLARHVKDDVGFEYGRLSCVYSDDDGHTWRQGREYLPTDTDGKPVLVQEPGVVELKDGRLYLYARTDRGRQWQAFSKDGGKTFADFGPSPICGPRGPATIKRLPDGRLLLVWNDHEGHPEYGKMGEKWLVGQRAPLTIAFSSDEGRTWTDRRTVDAEIEKGFFCYFATLVEGSDLLLLTYCRPHLNDACVYRIPRALD